MSDLITKFNVGPQIEAADSAMVRVVIAIVSGDLGVALVEDAA